MMQSARHSTPHPRDVVIAQLAAVGFALRRPALVSMGLLALMTLLVAISGELMVFHPERHVLPGTLGLLLPIGVWMGEERFEAGFLWTLPVDRRWHALAKVLAGWMWLMGAVALFVVWLLALALLSAGTLLSDETLRVVASSSSSNQGLLDPSAVQTVRWTPQPLLWLVPFTAATGTYLLTSALALGTRHPLRWIVGSVLTFAFLVVASEAANSEWLMNELDRLLGWLIWGPYGVDALLTARTGSLQVAATLSTGDTLVVWRALPDVGQWAIATLLWTGLGLAALWAAASRHRERRPA